MLAVCGLCIVVEQNDPTGELAFSFQFNHLVKGGQGLRVTLGIHCCPVQLEVYHSWSKKNVSITFPALLWMALVVVTLDASIGDFVVSILVRGINRNHCFTCITYAQKVILLTANTLQNNPPRLPHIFANNKEGSEYHRLCVMHLFIPSLIEMLLRCPRCLQTASHAAASSISE